MGKKYTNRELSWLDFNSRVLFQSMRQYIPLMERFNFLNITSSNLDEFIMVRFSSVMHSLSMNKTDISGLNPTEAYDTILKKIKEFKDNQMICFESLLNKLPKYNVTIKTADDLTSKERGYVSSIFNKEIFPLLTPMNFDTTKEYPEFSSKQLTIAVLLEDANMQVISFIPLDNSLKKMYKISKDKEVYITLEEIIYSNLKRIFYNKKILDYGMIKLLREADIELEHNTDVYITERMRQTLLMRRYSMPIFMECTNNISKSFIKLLRKSFDLDSSLVYKSSSSIDFSPYMSILKDDKSKWYKPFTPQYPEELLGDRDMFDAINNNDILLHHPYESYDPVIKFLEQASEDKNVLSIKQTLYRVSSSDSPIINALCNAAKNGKQVSVILEIKARFDEERNISLIDKLRTAGIQLVYGVENLKTHCKFISVVRREKNKLKIYTHVATGNYNEKTSKIYTDISYFTSNFKIGTDILSVFNMISGYSEPAQSINKVFFSPYNIRSQILKNINNERNNAKKGKKAFITLKMNALCDKEIIDALYDAASSGVKVVIFCRGICSIKHHKNIIVKSLIGRFLEHSRIYYFYNNKDVKLYISSADMLTRNLDKRFELLIPVNDNECRAKLLSILNMYYRDTFNTFTMNDKSEFKKDMYNKKNNINIHEEFMNDAAKKYKLKSLPKFKKK